MTRNEFFDGSWRKELQDSSRCHHPRGCEIEYDESVVRLPVHTSDNSNYLFLRPGDRVEHRNLLAA